MRIIENWTSIPCSWCRKIIDFVSYHDFGEPDLQISGINRRVLSYLGGNLSDQQRSLWRKKFVTIDLNLPTGETYIFFDDFTGDKVMEDAIGLILTCSPDCKDQFDLSTMNAINDYLTKKGQSKMISLLDYIRNLKMQLDELRGNKNGSSG